MISIGDLAAILTVASVSIYVVGLMGLAVTIRLRLASNISIAWYAVSLLPRTVVAGHGVRIWLTWPIVLVFVLLPVAYWAGTSRTVLITTFIVVVIAAVAILFRIVRSARSPMLLPSWITYEGRRIWHLGILPLVIGTLIMAAIGTYIMIAAAHLIVPLTDKHIVLGIMLLFVGGFFVGVPAALTVEPPLPYVEVTKKNSEGATWGRLITQSGGFWHLFVGSNSDKAVGLLDVNYELLSIPDAQVLAVRTVGNLKSAIPELRSSL